MNHFASGTDQHAVVITRIAERHWHALADDQVVGRGESWRRPDGRTFVSVDAWHGPVFDQLAAAVLADLPRPLYTVVDEADVDLTAHWQRAGFTTLRREWEYLVPTDPEVTGLGAAPPGVRVGPAGEASALRALDRVVRAEVEATLGWQEMPAEVLSPPVLDLSRYVVAEQDGQYVGLCRMGPVPRQPRISMLAVRADHQRRGVARALLTHVLDSLYSRGIDNAWTDVKESNPAATALFEGLGARRTSSSLELVIR